MTDPDRSPSSPVGGPAQRGAAGILMALFLLALLASLAGGASRNALRDLAMAGPGVHGAKAFFAAESALAWVLAGAGGGWDPWLVAGEPGNDVHGVRWLPAGGEAPLDRADGTSFRVAVRFQGSLGPVRAGPGRPGGPDHPARADPGGPSGPLWEVTAHGFCRPAGSRGETYHQVCRARVLAPGPGPPPGGPGVRVLAWTIER